MKPLIFCIPFILVFLAGCSITYRAVYDSSIEEFYEDYNKSAGSHTVKIRLSNDSSLSTVNKTKIIGDTLYSFENSLDKKYFEISTKEIKKIIYLSNDSKTGDLWLSNGVQLRGENIYISKDSANFLGIREVTVKNALTPASSLKTISYKNHWKGVIPGILSGVLLGGILGTTGWIIHPMDGGNTEQFAQAEATIAGAFCGLIVGGVVGYIIGFNINYQFQ